MNQIQACGDPLHSERCPDQPGLPRSNHNKRNTGNLLNSRSSALAQVYTARLESEVTAFIHGWALAPTSNTEKERTKEWGKQREKGEKKEEHSNGGRKEEKEQKEEGQSQLIECLLVDLWFS